mgnify:CR=1 FL=1
MYVDQRVVDLKKVDINESIDKQNELRTMHHQNREMIKTGVMTTKELAKQEEKKEERKAQAMAYAVAE